MFLVIDNWSAAAAPTTRISPSRWRDRRRGPGPRRAPDRRRRAVGRDPAGRSGRRSAPAWSCGSTIRWSPTSAAGSPRAIPAEYPRPRRHRRRAAFPGRPAAPRRSRRDGRARRRRRSAGRRNWASTGEAPELRRCGRCRGWSAPMRCRPAPSGAVPIGIEELSLDVVGLDLAGVRPAPARARRARVRAHVRAATDRAGACRPSSRRAGAADRHRLPPTAWEISPTSACRVDHVTRMPRLDEVMAELRELTVARLRALDGDGPWRRAGEIYVLSTTTTSSPAWASIPWRRSATSSSRAATPASTPSSRAQAPGAGRAVIDPVLSRLTESGAPALLLSGDPHEGPLVRGVRAEPLPPGRGAAVAPPRPPSLVQLGLAVAPDTTSPEKQTERHRRDLRARRPAHL